MLLKNECYLACICLHEEIMLFFHGRGYGFFFMEDVMLFFHGGCYVVVSWKMLCSCFMEVVCSCFMKVVMLLFHGGCM